MGVCCSVNTAVETTPRQVGQTLLSAHTSDKSNVPRSSFRTFDSAHAKGGVSLIPSRTALLLIEFQNEFTTEGGKLHSAVKPVMQANDMLKKSAHVAEVVRCAGGKVFHIPISFAADASDNPNKGLGILQGCAKDNLFAQGSWNADICDVMKPAESDVVVVGKKSLDAFPNTDLEAHLVAHGMETIVLCGFLTNCCVESTMRTGCEKGFNVITLVDCTAATSPEGQKAATEGTFGMFSKPMTAENFITQFNATQVTSVLPPTRTLSVCPARNDRAFSPQNAKGGTKIVASKTAVLFIEYQNEFTSIGGKLYGAVSEVMEANNMLAKSMEVARATRVAGGKVFHVPISFAAGGVDNPNKQLGILAGCAKDNLFAEGTWNSDICELMTPVSGDVIIKGKKGLDAFPDTDLEAQLLAHGIETVAICGFLTNCCVESTMRTACEKGFHVVTVIDCTATTSMEGQKAATQGTFGMFSETLSAQDFLVRLSA